MACPPKEIALIDFTRDSASDKCKSKRETGQNTVESMSSEDMHEEKREMGEKTVESMSSEDVHEKEKETREFVKSVAHLSQ